ncbi:GNAT family N-acetyltransferase [Phaeobacter porticola]|uniref:Acetyltransferase n=1 Tax=Phaeobacter porticola TaxID=1844006 RepID=A0A1L3I8Y3_9RHOB|nr:GNAT family N-acetyltransferase [Phaeobacter porticola]APG48483.1 Acetyltransferase [Phaeobacter porticola]
MMLEARSLTGAALETALPDLAALRIEVFRAFPYLYEGDAEYEQQYLRAYRDTADAILVAAYDGDKIIGAATGMPLVDHGDASQLHGFAGDMGAVFYCAESVLLPEYRGQGLGHAFFDHRETHAQSLGFAKSAFCAVIRPDTHPLRPADYRSHDVFWTKRGYAPMPDVEAEFSWRDVGDERESRKKLRFWMRDL